jgi:hypothetical protein
MEGRVRDLLNRGLCLGRREGDGEHHDHAWQEYFGFLSVHRRPRVFEQVKRVHQVNTG